MTKSQDIDLKELEERSLSKYSKEVFKQFLADKLNRIENELNQRNRFYPRDDVIEIGEVKKIILKVFIK